MSKQPFHKAHHKKREQSVNDFLIWRAANSVSWDCSIRELAAEVGLSVGAVERTLKRRGWSEKLTPYERIGYPGRHAVDRAMENGGAHA